jgi:hypothetical protein
VIKWSTAVSTLLDDLLEPTTEETPPVIRGTALKLCIAIILALCAMIVVFALYHYAESAYHYAVNQFLTDNLSSSPSFGGPIR